MNSKLFKAELRLDTHNAAEEVLEALNSEDFGIVSKIDLTKDKGDLVIIQAYTPKYLKAPWIIYSSRPRVIHCTIILSSPSAAETTIELFKGSGGFSPHHPKLNRLVKRLKEGLDYLEKSQNYTQNRLLKRDSAQALRN